MKGVGGCGDRYFDHEKKCFFFVCHIRVLACEWTVSEMKHSPFQRALQFASDEYKS